MRSEDAIDSGNSDDASGSDAAPGPINPSDIGAAPGTGAAPKRGRGRPAGSGSSGRKSAPAAAEKKKASTVKQSDYVPIDENSLGFLIGLASQALSFARQEPALELDEEEKTKIAKPMAHALSFRKLPLSAEQQAWAAVAIITGSIYVAKFTAIRMLKNV